VQTALSDLRRMVASSPLTEYTCCPAGPEHIFVRTADAVEYAQEQQLAGSKVGKEGPAIHAV